MLKDITSLIDGKDIPVSKHPMPLAWAFEQSAKPAKKSKKDAPKPNNNELKLNEDGKKARWTVGFYNKEEVIVRSDTKRPGHKVSVLKAQLTVLENSKDNGVRPLPSLVAPFLKRLLEDFDACKSQPDSKETLTIQLRDAAPQ